MHLFQVEFLMTKSSPPQPSFLCWVVCLSRLISAWPFSRWLSQKSIKIQDELELAMAAGSRLKLCLSQNGLVNSHLLDSPVAAKNSKSVACFRLKLRFHGWIISIKMTPLKIFSESSQSHLAFCSILLLPLDSCFSATDFFIFQKRCGVQWTPHEHLRL